MGKRKPKSKTDGNVIYLKEELEKRNSCEFAGQCPIRSFIKKYPHIRLSTAAFIAVTDDGNGAVAHSKIQDKNANALLRAIDTLLLKIHEIYNEERSSREE